MHVFSAAIDSDVSYCFAFNKNQWIQMMCVHINMCWEA